MKKLLVLLALCFFSSTRAMEHVVEQGAQEDAAPGTHERARYADIPRPKYEHPLLNAVHTGTLQEVKVLVEGTETGVVAWARRLIEKPDLSARSYEGKNALHVAAERGSEEIITYLLSQGMSINSLTETGRTPLDLAVAFGHLGAVRLLVRNGIVGVLESQKCLNVAAECGRAQIVEFFLRDKLIKATEEALFKAAGNTHAEVCRLLVAEGVVQKELPILAVAMRRGNTPELTELLLNAGCDVNYSYKGERIGNDEATALVSAAKYGQIESMKILLKRGAHVALVPENGSSALHWATAAKTPDGVCLLFRAGIDPLIGGVTYHGRDELVPEIALGRAARIEKDEMCTFLLLASLYQVNLQEAAHRLRLFFWSINQATTHDNFTFPAEVWAHLFSCTVTFGFDALSLITQKCTTIAALKEELFGEKRHPVCKAWGYERTLDILASGTVDMACKQYLRATQQGKSTYPRSTIPFLKESIITQEERDQFIRNHLAQGNILARLDAGEEHIINLDAAQASLDTQCIPLFYPAWRAYLRSLLIEQTIETKKKDECVIC